MRARRPALAASARALWLLICLLLAPVAAAGEKEATASTIESADELIAAGRHEDAIAQLIEALGQTEDARARSMIHGRLAIAHHYARDTAAVRDHAETALELIADHPDALEVRADALAALALYLGETGQREAYLDTSLAELELRHQLPPAQSRLAVPLINIGLAHAEAGDYRAAEHFLQQALDHARQHEADSRQVPVIRNNLAYVYALRQEFRSAASMLESVVDAARQEAPGSVILAMRLANLGAVLRSLGRMDEAREAVQEALEIQLERIPGTIDEARTRYALAQIFEREGQIDDAEQQYRRSLEITERETPDASWLVYPLRALASLLIETGRMDRAEPLLERALQLSDGDRTNPGEHAASLFQAGRLSLARGDAAGALTAWSSAVDALDLQYELLGGSAFTLASFAERYEPLFRQYAQLLIDEGQHSEAIQVLERYRNRALLERLDVERILRQTESGQRLLGDLSQLERETLNLLGEDAQSGHDHELRAVRLAELRRERERAVAAAVAATPSLAELIVPTAQDMGLNEAGLRTSDRQRILYFSIGKHRGDLLVIGPHGVEAFRVPGADEIDPLVEQYRLLLQRPDSSRDVVSSIGARLHGLLLGEAADALAGAEELLIRVDGTLFLLPFSSLVDDDGHFLIESFRIQQLQRLAPSSQGTPWRMTPETRFTGFAFAGDEVTVALSRRELGRLEHVADEVKRAAALFGQAGRTYIEEAASEARVRTVSGGGILHFASHAVADPVQPASSFISLAPGDGHDGRLELWEIMESMRIDAELVVLSGCDTALGPTFAGEGLFGLSKAFAFAGARSIIASLWPIDDASTMHLFTVFYRELQANGDPSAALAQAQRAMLGGALPRRGLWARLSGRTHVDYSHPYYWAPFTLTTMR